MNWQDELEGIRINASRAPGWVCTQAQAGAVAGLLDALFAKIVVQACGWSEADLEDFAMRDLLRIPFLNYLFEDANYGTWVRTTRIESASDLSSGEASTILDWLGVSEEGAYNTLLGWVRGVAKLWPDESVS